MKNKEKKRVAIYARVSTFEKGQDPETQLRQLREYVTRRNFSMEGEFIDYASGKTENREQYKAMLDLVRKRHIDVVLVWRYDRFARSTQALVNALNEWVDDKLHVHVKSLTRHLWFSIRKPSIY